MASTLSGHFRGRKITAPLKLDVSKGAARGEMIFPWSKDHGSIEAKTYALMSCARLVIHFRGRKITAPLKRKLGTPARKAKAISVVERSRLH